MSEEGPRLDLGSNRPQPTEIVDKQMFLMEKELEEQNSNEGAEERRHKEEEGGAALQTDKERAEEPADEGDEEQEEHEEQEGGGEGPEVLCKHYQRGHCLFGESCRFLHQAPTTPPPERARYNEQGKRKRARVRNRGRAGVFRRWLLAEFGREVLGAGAGVLDVAGGKSELAFQLVNLNRLPATIVDPRATHTGALQSYTDRLALGMYHKNAVLRAYVDAPAGPAVPAPHVRLFFEAPLWRLAGSEAYPAYCQAAAARASGTEWTKKGLTPGPATPWSGPAPAQLAALLASASVVVGMHPDQAAEAIVDFGLETRRPFALVPCCVYSAEFPKRRLRDGQRVTSYAALLQYLREKNPTIRQTTLDIGGRNQLLYWRPEFDLLPPEPPLPGSDASSDEAEDEGNL